MVDTWFTSDHHFGHSKILEYEKVARPFATLDQMHTALIDNWNNTIGINDIVYHLGDFAFGRKNISIAGDLHGKKRLILGNHDTYPTAEYLKYFEKLYGAFHWHDCILSHIPIHPDHLASRWWVNVHGHLHSHTVKMDEKIVDGPFGGARKITDLNYMNMSVEQHNLTPVHADFIMERVKQIQS